MSFKQHIPSAIKRSLKYLADSVLDLVEYLFSRRNPMVPARRHTFIGRGEFVQDGDAFLKTLDETLATVGDDAQLTQIELQNWMQKMQQCITACSNVSKMKHDGIQTVNRNLKA